MSGNLNGHDEHDLPSVETIEGLVLEALRTMEGDLTVTDLRIEQELHALSTLIEQTRRELSAIQPDHIRTHDIPSANDELDAVVAAAEEATHTILECAEEIEAINRNVEGELAERLSNTVTRIYEACNFQDITGQRVTKVVNTLRRIEEKIAVLTGLIDGHDGDPEANRPGAASANGDAALLNGPAAPGEATSQADIDRILASFD